MHGALTYTSCSCLIGALSTVIFSAEIEIGERQPGAYTQAPGRHYGPGFCWVSASSCLSHGHSLMAFDGCHTSKHTPYLALDQIRSPGQISPDKDFPGVLLSGML